MIQSRSNIMDSFTELTKGNLSSNNPWKGETKFTLPRPIFTIPVS